MELTKETDKIDISGKSMLLMSAVIANDYKPDYQPDARVLYVEKENAQNSEDRLNFLADLDGTISTARGNKYMFRMSLQPGRYKLLGISGTSGSFPVRGTFFMPIHADVIVEPATIAYLGRVEGRIRERNGNEFRAGIVLPLIDQAVTGFSGGTFDVMVSDATAEDIQVMQNIFPALNGLAIQPRVLPPFDRQKAQKWWEDH
jgi:hypothetical protein